MKIESSNNVVKKQKELQLAGSDSEKTRIVLKGNEEVASESAKLLRVPSKALLAFASAMKKLNIF